LPQNGDLNHNREVMLRRRKKLALYSTSLSSLESVGGAEREGLLDFGDMKAAAGDIKIMTYDSDDGDLSDDDINLIKKKMQEEDAKDQRREKEKEEKKKKKLKCDFEPHPKMNTLVGFLRLANYISACNVAFGIAISLFWPREEGEAEPK
jgi:hypothetical protein